MKAQTGATEPLRDWFPLSAAGAVSDVTDLIAGPGADWGTMKCGCHPNCGTGTALLVSKKTKKWAPLPEVFDVERFFDDARTIADAARGPLLTKVQTALSVLRNYRPARAPEGFRLTDLIKKFDKQSGGALGGVGTPADGNRKSDEWLVLFIAGMWFQDLWTYDFRRTEMCIIPYATQMGEISFCAYNTGVGWRHIVEKMHQNATVAEWYKEHGKHAVYANPRKPVPLQPTCAADRADDSQRRRARAGRFEETCAVGAGCKSSSAVRGAPHKRLGSGRVWLCHGRVPIIVVSRNSRLPAERTRSQMAEPRLAALLRATLTYYTLVV